MKNNFPGKPRIGISAVLGWKVRYDGSDRKDAFLAETIASHIAWMPVSPEVEVGMGVPRRPVRLVGQTGAPRMLAEGSGTDWTPSMNSWTSRKLEQLKAAELSGYVLKKNSSSL